MSEETSRRIGDYEILEVLGRGGMGKVFKVRNVISDRIEAMKILLPDLAGQQELADRFQREIKLLASLNHPNIASLQTALTLNNQLVMVMEFVEGMTLSDRLEQGSIAATDAVKYTEQVLGALSYAHRRNIIHRDIKPANMMLTPDGVVKLMDFGIARSASDRGLTATGTTLGSLFYMSPEQVKGETTDARSDLYSLGISLYEMVTGQCPFRADSDYSIMAAQIQQLPKPPIELRPDLPAALNEIILTAIEKEPARRFQVADAFRNALGSLRGKLPASVPLKQSALPIDPSVSAPAGATAMLQRPGAGGSLNEAVTAPLAIPAQAESIPSVLELSARPKSHRGLYMSLGALIVLIVLVLAGLYVPQKFTTRASEQKQGTERKSSDSSAASGSALGLSDADKTKGQDGASIDDPQQQSGAADPGQTTAQPAASKETMTDSTTGESTGPKQVDQARQASMAEVVTTVDRQTGKQPTAKSLNTHASNDRAKMARPGDGQAGKAAPSAGGEQPATYAGRDASGPASPDSTQLQALEEHADQLSSRVTSLNDSLDNLRNQQAAQGYGLRRDIAATQELMKTHLANAQTALQNQDAAGARKYLDLAEEDAAKIDKFLGK